MSKVESSNQKIAISFRFILDFCFATDSVDVKNPSRKEGEKKEFVARLRALLGAVNRLNQKGIMIKITWCIGAMRSYDLLLKLAPELVEEIKTRVAVGYDEINDYSRNEALMPLMTGRELLLLNEITQDNPFVQLAEPLMPMAGGVYSPTLLPYFEQLGIKAISFNITGIEGFSSEEMIQSLPFEQHYNPMWLSKRNSKEKTILIPSFSIMDLINEGGLKKMVLKIQNRQQAESKSNEILLLFDEYISSSLLFDKNEDWDSPSFCLLEKEIDSVAMYSFLIWTTPAQYLRRNTPKGLMIIDRDVIAGVDGTLNSWGGKWENRALWSKIQRSRLYCDQALSRADRSGKKRLIRATEEKVQSIEIDRIKLLDESYFGPCSMTQRINYVEMGLAKASQVEKNSLDLVLNIVDQTKELKEDIAIDEFKRNLKHSSLDHFHVGENFIENNAIRIEHSDKKGILVTYKEIFNAKPVESCFSVVRKGRQIEDTGHIEYISSSNRMAQMIIAGTLHLRPSTRVIKWKYIYSLKEGEANVYLNVQVKFPNGELLDKVGVGGSVLDLNLDEIHPAKILLPEIAWPTKSFRFWRDSCVGNGCESQPCYLSIDKQRNELLQMMDNRKQIVLNSQIVNRWFGIGFNTFGLAIAQKIEQDQSFAFCPFRFEKKGSHLSVHMNLLGQYYKREADRDYKNLSTWWLYHSWNKGESSVAATYGGKTISASYMFAPFKGNDLPKELIQDLNEFSSSIDCVALKEREFDVTG